MSVIGKVVSFYNEKGTTTTKVYESSTGKSYRIAVVQIPGKGAVSCRAYNTDLEVGDQVEISPLANTDSGEVALATTGEMLFSCRLNTTVDNSILNALFAKPEAKVEGII